MKYSITLSEKHYNELRGLIFQADDFERVAIVLCGRASIENDLWDGGMEERFLSHKVMAIPESEIIEHSKAHVFWDTATFRRAMKICKEEDLAICVVHNHSNDALKYSIIDDENEPKLFKGIFNRNGIGKPHASLVITRNGNIFGRIWTKTLTSQDFYLVRIFGENFGLHYADKFSSIPNEIFHRQQIAFGNALNNNLSKLTVGIVGCGATGSATASLLSRLGIRKLLLIDDDVVDRTNLNRLHGSTASDADAGRNKVEVVRDFVAGSGVGTRVRIIKDWVGSEQSRLALRSCDVIFGCTDDNSGRIFLNRYAHFYLTPVFDMGIVIEPDQTDNQKLKCLQGRVTVIITGNNCLLCQGIVDPTIAAEEDLKRSDPRGFERRKEEGYVVGSGNPSPSVVTFTTEISCVAVNELLNRIIKFKKLGPQNNLMRFFDQGIDRKPGGKRRPDCPLCDSENFWGKGDIKPFMDQAY
jgi:molybdopterin/thiamine biosynthesis adenylyltransferase